MPPPKIVPPKVDDIALALADSVRSELPWLPGVHLARRHRQILALLMARESVHRDVIHAALYSGQAGDGPTVKIVDVYLSKVRQALESLGVPDPIPCMDGRWWLTPKAKNLVRDLMKQQSETTPGAKSRTIVHKIEKGVPMPANAMPAHVHAKYRKFRWDIMQPGDSFFAENTTAIVLRGAARAYCKSHKSKREFAAADVVENDKIGARAWRIK